MERLMLRMVVAWTVALAAAASFGCQQKMADQPSYQPLEGSHFFADRRSARPLVPGTVARGHLRIDLARYTGRKTRDKEPSVERDPAPPAGSEGAQRLDENRDFVEHLP